MNIKLSSDRTRSDSHENMLHTQLELKKHDSDEEIQWRNDSLNEIELNVLTGTEIDPEAIPTKSLPSRPRCFCLYPWCCCCCVWMLGLSWKIKIPVIIVLVVFVVWAVLSLDMNSCVYTAIKIAPLPDPSQLLPSGKQPPTAAVKQSHGFVLTLLGNSVPSYHSLATPIHPP